MARIPHRLRLYTGCDHHGTSGATYGTLDFATIKHSSEGVPLWTNRYNGPTSPNRTDRVPAVAVDADGNAIVTGYSVRADASADYATIKYSPAGVPLWTNRFRIGQAGSVPYALALDANGNVFVTGDSRRTGSPFADYATIAYSSAGLPLWTNSFNGPANGQDEPSAMAVDPSGNVIVTGISDGGGTGTDFVTVKSTGFPPPPIITSTALVGTNLVFAGARGTAGGTYYVLSSTTVAAAMPTWPRTATNTFGPGGTFSVTNPVDPARTGQFFRLQIP